MARPRTRWLRGDRHAAACPTRDGQGRPAWQGIVVVEPDEILWRCEHLHLVDPADKGRSHAEAVACAERHDREGARP